MSAGGLRKAAETLRGFEEGDTIHVSHEVAAAFADWLDTTAHLWAQGISDRMNRNALAVAHLINGDQS